MVWKITTREIDWEEKREKNSVDRLIETRRENHAYNR